MPLDYTEISGAIVRGGRWPAADGYVRTIITRTEDGVALNWPAGADAWTWCLLISRSQLGRAVDLTLTAPIVTVTLNVATLYFYASEAQTNSLPNDDKTRYWVQIRSTTGAGEDSYYGNGRADVESSVGEA